MDSPKLLIILIALLSIFLIKDINAQTLNSTNFINTTSGINMTFNKIPVEADKIIVTPISIELTNFSYILGNLIVNATTILNYTIINQIDSSNFLNIFSETDQIKYIQNNLNNTVNGTFTFYLKDKKCSQIQLINYRSQNGIYQKNYLKLDIICINNSISIKIIGIESNTKTNEINIDYRGDEICDSWEHPNSVDCNEGTFIVSGSGTGSEKEESAFETPLNITSNAPSKTSKYENDFVYWLIIGSSGFLVISLFVFLISELVKKPKKKAIINEQ